MTAKLGSYFLIDSTLREGQQNAVCNFTTGQKREFLLLLENFGIEYAEIGNPISSQIAFQEYQELLRFKQERNLKLKLIVHVRNCFEDIHKCFDVVDYVPDGISIVISTSNILRESSHRQNIDQIIDSTRSNLEYIKAVCPSVEIRFSTEDSFRTDCQELYKLYHSISDYVDRIGIADTVGIATHWEIENLVRTIRKATNHDLPIECHFHNDSASAVYNSFVALLSGCSHINTSVLGIGERNGITDLTGLIARLYTFSRTSVEKYHLPTLPELDRFVATAIGHPIPLNNPITGPFAFCHKAGIHTNAMIRNKKCYQIITNTDFGLPEQIIVFSPIMGYNALKHFIVQYIQTDDTKGTQLINTTYQLKQITQQIKQLIAKDPSLGTRLNSDSDFAKAFVLDRLQH
ncbi:MAG: homocitrate synthase [Proteobacteria bacterium]|nr:homocitrate synthase [Pseudomonadota bacterium]NBP13907.1 homocitrate synthase [bacterium]